MFPYTHPLGHARRKNTLSRWSLIYGVSKRVHYGILIQEDTKIYVDFQSLTQANTEKKIWVLPTGLEPDDLLGLNATQRRLMGAEDIKLGSDILHIALKRSKSQAYTLRCCKMQQFFLQSAMATPSAARPGPCGRNLTCTTHPLSPPLSSSPPPSPLCMSRKVNFPLRASPNI